MGKLVATLGFTQEANLVFYMPQWDASKAFNEEFKDPTFDDETFILSFVDHRRKHVKIDIRTLLHNTSSLNKINFKGDIPLSITKGRFTGITQRSFACFEAKHGKKKLGVFDSIAEAACAHFRDVHCDFKKSKQVLRKRRIIIDEEEELGYKKFKPAPLCMNTINSTFEQQNATSHNKEPRAHDRKGEVAEQWPLAQKGTFIEEEEGREEGEEKGGEEEGEEEGREQEGEEEEEGEQEGEEEEGEQGGEEEEEEEVGKEQGGEEEGGEEGGEEEGGEEGGEEDCIVFGSLTNDEKNKKGFENAINVE